MRKFYCYSVRLKNALIANGFTPISYGVNPSTNSPYWVFEGTEELNNYKNNKYQLERDNFSAHMAAADYKEVHKDGT